MVAAFGNMLRAGAGRLTAEIVRSTARRRGIRRNRKMARHVMSRAPKHYAILTAARHLLHMA